MDSVMQQGPAQAMLNCMLAVFVAMEQQAQMYGHLVSFRPCSIACMMDSTQSDNLRGPEGLPWLIADCPS